MSLPVPLALKMLEVALAARAGRLAVADRLALAEAALGPDVPERARAAALAFLIACRADRAAEAGAVLSGFLADCYPLPPDAAMGWAERADCGH